MQSSVKNQLNGSAAQPPKARRIVICADDFGIDHAVDAGILRLAGAGRLSAVSCLALGPSFAGRAPELRAADVDVGLHFDLTEGVGGQEPAIALGELIARACLGRLAPGWVDGRLERQLDAFERVHGEAPAHLDGHQHVHQLPGVLPRVVEILRRRYGERAPWLRCTLPRHQPGVGASNLFKAHVIGALGGHALQRATRRNGWRGNERFLGVYGLSGGADHYARLLRRWLEAAHDGDLLMCHPACPEHPAPLAVAGGGDALMRQRAAEYQTLAGGDIARWLLDLGLRVERLGRIRPPSG